MAVGTQVSGQGKCRGLPFGPNGCACRKPKSGGRGLLLSGCWSSWLDEGRVVASRSQAGLGRGLPRQGVDNCLATLARLGPGRVMSIGTVEAGGEVLHSGWRKGRVSVWSEQGRSVASGVEEGRLRLPGRGSGVRFLGSGL